MKTIMIIICNSYKEQQTMATEALKVLLLCLLTSGRPIGRGLPTGVEAYSSQVTGAGQCGDGGGSDCLRWVFK